MLLETHCLEWPADLGAEGGYGKIIRVELLHKLHDELKYDGLDALTRASRKDCDDARAFFASTTPKPAADHARPNLDGLSLRTRPRSAIRRSIAHPTSWIPASSPE